MESNVVRIEHRDIISAGDLPEGKFQGIWGGYVAEAEINGKSYRFYTLHGIRCMDCPCTVHVQHSVVWVEIEGESET